MTPSVQRAADALQKGSGVTHPWAMSVTPQMLNAALSNPEDPDWLARQLFMLHSYGGIVPEADLRAAWGVHGEKTHDHWRSVADGLRTLITGEPT